MIAYFSDYTVPFACTPSGVATSTPGVLPERDGVDSTVEGGMSSTADGLGYGLGIGIIAGPGVCGAVLLTVITVTLVVFAIVVVKRKLAAKNTDSTEPIFPEPVYEKTAKEMDTAYVSLSTNICYGITTPSVDDGPLYATMKRKQDIQSTSTDYDYVIP